MNKVIMKGNLTRDVEIRYTPSGAEIANFGIACNRKWKTAQGEIKEDVMFIDVQAWGKTATTIQQYFAKGSQILIEGRLQLERWEDKETKAKRSKHIIVCERMHFAGGAKPAAAPAQPRPAGAPARPQGQAAQPAQEPAEDLDIPEENIPF